MEEASMDEVVDFRLKMGSGENINNCTHLSRIVQYINILKKLPSMKLSKIPPYPFSIRINLLATNSRIEGHSFPVRFAVGSLPPSFLP